MKLERTIEQYRNGKPEVIVKGSEAQVLFALQDSRKDILTLAAELDEARAWIAEATKVITEIAGGGSEFFVMKGEAFRADPRACRERIRDREARAHEHLLKAIRERNEARDALRECEDYFDQRADADCDQDGYIPNEEMKLLTLIRDALGKAAA